MRGWTKHIVQVNHHTASLIPIVTSRPGPDMQLGPVPIQAIEPVLRPTMSSSQEEIVAASSAPDDRANILRAAAWVMGSLASFAAMAIAGRELGKSMSTFELMTYRGSIGLSIVIIILTLQGWHHIRPNKLWLFGIRNVIHFGAQYAWFVGLTMLPLTEVFAIEFTQPLWVAVIATVFLGEKLNRYRVIALGLGFFGILTILRPGIEILQPASFIVLSAAIGFAVSVSLTKYHLREVSPLAVVFYMLAMQTPMALIPAISVWVGPSWADVPAIAIVGVTGLTSHYCLAKALSLADATVVIPLDFLRLPLIALMGFLIYGEALEIWVALGAVMVCFGNYLSVRRAR